MWVDKSGAGGTFGGAGMGGAVLFRRAAAEALEDMGEVAVVVEPDDLGDVGHGPVGVFEEFAGGALTDVTALQLTNPDGRSVQISNSASPILAQEVLSSQSAQVSNVGGATYTSQAYLQSLQSALDQAGF